MKLNLALRFLLEVGALISFAAVGWTLGPGWTSWLLAIAFPVGAATIWGTFNVPNDPSRSGGAPIPVPGTVRLLLEAGFFSLALAASVITASPIVTVTFAILIAVHYAFASARIQWLLNQTNLTSPA